MQPGDVDIKQIKQLFGALFSRRQSAGRLCIGALPNNLHKKEAEELRDKGLPLPRTHRATWQFFGAGDMVDLVQFLQSAGRDRGLHMRQSRFKPDAAAGKRLNVIEATHCWLDVDAKHLVGKKLIGWAHDTSTLDNVLMALGGALITCPMPPTAVVQSGGGAHAYWRLAQSQTTEQGFNDVEETNTQLARIFSGDVGAITINDPLRLPGTFNFNYDPPRPCVVAHVNPEVEYARDDLMAWATGQLPLFGEQVEVKPGDEFKHAGEQLAKQRRRGVAKGREGWRQILSDLQTTGEGKRHTAALSLTAKMTSMKWSRDYQLEVFRANGCALPQGELESIVDHAIEREKEAT